MLLSKRIISLITLFAMLFVPAAFSYAQTTGTTSQPPSAETTTGTSGTGTGTTGGATTGTGTTGGGTTATPGVPNTGAGGNAAFYLGVIAFAGLITVFGLISLLNRRPSLKK